MDLLDRLISKSLIIALEANETTRYTLLDTMRSYLMACLTAAREVDTARARHRDWCIDVAERMDAGQFDPLQLAVLASEHRTTSRPPCTGYSSRTRRQPPAVWRSA